MVQLDRRREGGAWARARRLAPLLASGLILLSGLAAWTWWSLGGGVPRGPAVRPAVAQSAATSIDSDEQLISLDRAKEIARQFSGLSRLELAGGLERGVYGARRYALYHLESPPGAEAQRTFTVDARSGELLEMRSFEALDRAITGSSADQQSAQRQAEQFAADRFAGFSDLSLVERTTSLTTAGAPLFNFKWAKVAPETKAELPTSVAVAVSSTSGQVLWYVAQRDPVDIELNPAISRENAISAAQELVDSSERWDVRAPMATRLQVIYDDENHQRLAWSVVFAGRANPAALTQPNLRLLIDARTGQPVTLGP